MLRLIAAWTVVAANVIAAAYIVVLAYTQIKNRARTGEIKFYYGIGPVLIPIDVGGGKPGTAAGIGKCPKNEGTMKPIPGFNDTWKCVVCGLEVGRGKEAI